VDIFLKSLGNRKVPELYPDSAIGLCRVLSNKEQIKHFLVGKVIVTLDVRFIDFQAGGRSKEMLYLVDALHAFVGLQVMNWLEYTLILILHFVVLLELGYSRDAALFARVKKMGGWPLFFDSRGTVEHATFATSQNDLAGTHDGNLMSSFHRSVCTWTGNYAGRRSWVSTVVRGADTGHLDWAANIGSSRVTPFRIRTRRKGLR
jgi:hypothetical protein